MRRYSVPKKKNTPELILFFCSPFRHISLVCCCRLAVCIFMQTSKGAMRSVCITMAVPWLHATATSLHRWIKRGERGEKKKERIWIVEYKRYSFWIKNFSQKKLHSGLGPFSPLSLSLSLVDFVLIHRIPTRTHARTHSLSLSVSFLLFPLIVHRARNSPWTMWKWPRQRSTLRTCAPSVATCRAAQRRWWGEGVRKCEFWRVDV